MQNENTARAYEWAVSAVKKAGQDAQIRTATYIKRITKGKHFLIANYNADSTISDEVKLAAYRRLNSAMVANGGKPDWAALEAAQDGLDGERYGNAVEVQEVKDDEEAALQAADDAAVVTATIDRMPEVPKSDKAAQLAQVLREMLSNPSAQVDAKQVEAIVDSKLGDVKTTMGDELKEMRRVIDDALADQVKRIEVKLPGAEAHEVKGLAHERFELLLKMAATRTNVLVTGPTGSGKTHGAENVAKALNLPFYYNGAIDSEYKLKGFIDAGGKVICPAFRKAWENGGVYLFDEVDASLPSAVLSFNGALSNHICDFPDKMVERHKDCIIIATANTWLGGSTFDYVGRMKQDAAFADRFAMLYWGIDEKLERALCSNKDWVKFVQKIRKAVVKQGLKVIVSPRATFNGERLLAAGIDKADVIATTVRKGMTDDQWKVVNPSEEESI